MKRTRLLIALLVMLVAASGFAQDSYRETVKQYLHVDEGFEQDKKLMSTMKLLFVQDGKVDIDQLNERYINERLVDDYLDLYVPILQQHNVSEAELQEVFSLVSTPQGKTYSAHFAEWNKELARRMMKPMKEALEDMLPGEELVINPVEPNPDIDATYTAKFKKLQEVNPLVSQMIEAIEAQMNISKPDINEDIVKDVERAKEINDESDNKILNWIKDNLPVIALNAAYDKMTVEDLDQAVLLYSNEAYRKMKGAITAETEQMKTINLFTKYLDWMKAQGATVNEDPKAMMEFYKILMGEAGVDMDFDNPYLNDSDLGTRKPN